jgi:hypothetical protein
MELFDIACLSAYLGIRSPVEGEGFSVGDHSRLMKYRVSSTARSASADPSGFGPEGSGGSYGFALLADTPSPLSHTQHTPAAITCRNQ